jgi:hypothetical protein
MASIVDLMVANIHLLAPLTRGNLLKLKKYLYFNRGIDTVKVTALSNHKPRIRIRIKDPILFM